MLNRKAAIETFLIFLCLILVTLIAFELLPLPEPEIADRAVRAVPLTPNSGLPAVRPTVYRKSLIPGGVHDSEALRSAVLRDPVLMAAFAGFNWAAAAPCVVPAGEFFVSYRLGNEIRWTTHPGSLAGQGCISDGKQTVLTRCGNLISYVPQSPTGTETPSSLSLPEPTSLIPSAPMLPNHPVQQIDLPRLPPTDASAPATPSDIVGTAPFIPISVVYIPTTTPTVQVPEPNTLDLVLISLILAAILYRGRQIARYRRRR